MNKWARLREVSVVSGWQFSKETQSTVSWKSVSDDCATKVASVATTTPGIYLGASSTTGEGEGPQLSWALEAFRCDAASKVMLQEMLPDFIFLRLWWNWYLRLRLKTMDYGLKNQIWWRLNCGNGNLTRLPYETNCIAYLYLLYFSYTWNNLPMKSKLLEVTVFY